jgi:hypothetical protein
MISTPTWVHSSNAFVKGQLATDFWAFKGITATAGNKNPKPADRPFGLYDSSGTTPAGSPSGRRSAGQANRVLRCLRPGHSCDAGEIAASIFGTVGIGVRESLMGGLWQMSYRVGQ